MTRFNGRIVLSALMTGVFALFVAQTFDYSRAARLAPLVAGIPGLLLSIAQLVIEIRQAMADGAPRDAGRAGEQRRALSLIIWFTVMIAASILLGVIATALITVYAFLRYRQNESPRLSAALAGGFTAILYLVFNVALGTELFEGFVYLWTVA